MQIASDELLSHYFELSRTDFALSDDRFVTFCVRADPCRAFLKFELVPGADAYDKFEANRLLSASRETETPPSSSLATETKVPISGPYNKCGQCAPLGRRTLASSHRLWRRYDFFKKWELL